MMDLKHIPSLQRVATEKETVRLSILFAAGTVAFEVKMTAPQITKLLGVMDKKGGVRRVL